MTGICGWINLGCKQQDPVSILNTMADGLIPAPVTHSAIGESGSRALFAQAAENRLHCLEKNGLMVSMTGQPIWSDEKFSEQAKQQSHAAVLMNAYQQHGPKLLDYLHGPFALAIIDNNKNEALLAIDRIGIQRLCYGQTMQDGVVFGSTADAVRRHPEMDSTIDNQHVFSYLFFHAVPSPGTIYHQQKKLLPGQYAHFKNGKLEIKTYWNPQFNDAGRGDFSTLKTELHEQLHSAVKYCTDTTGTPGAFLSGGVDSSAVSGMLGKVLGEPVNTYSIGFAAKGYDEMDYARAASKFYGTVHHEYYVTPEDVCDLLPRIASAYDEPFGNASAVPTYFCALLAKNDGTHALLSGDGGDELFGGNERYAQQKIFEFYGNAPGVLRSWLLEPLIFAFPGGKNIMPIRKARSYIEQANIPLPDRLESYNFINRIIATEVFTDDFLSSIDTDHPQKLQRERYADTHSNSIINRMLYLEWKQVLADNDLRKVTRMCSLAGVDAQFPLLQDNLVDFSTRIPPSFKVKGLKLRYFFKEALRDFLPPQVQSKSKHGFGLPFGVWLSSHPQLQQLAKDSLSDLKRRNFVRPEFIDNLTRQHQNEHAAFYGEAIWVFMMLELWLQAHEH